MAFFGLSVCPTARQLDADVHRTANSSFWSLAAVPAGLGTATLNQCLPVQCRTSFCSTNLLDVSPTAQQLAGEVQKIPKSWLDGLSVARPVSRLSPLISSGPPDDVA